MAGYHVENFGCRASQADGDAISAGLARQGLQATQRLAEATVVVVNTCSVTAEADRSARAFVRRARRLNPAAKIVVTGCYAQRAPEELTTLPEVDWVVGNSHKFQIPELIAGFAAESHTSRGFVPLTALQPAPAPAQLLISNIFAHTEVAVPAPLAADGNHTRPNLKVQDGCGNRCSFCVIPQTRGNSRSLDLPQVLRAVEEFVAAGGQELVLSGINLGQWGRDITPRRSLTELVRAILNQTALPRLRLSSIEPMDWTPELIALISTHQPRMARHAHVPLQSGSDSILRRMHRRYRPWHYAEKLRQIRHAMPEAAIGADVMVGFPGESEALFQESYDFIAAQPFTYLHLFPFSARPATPAWEMYRQNPVPAKIVDERMAALRELIARKHRAFRQQWIGATLPAITLQGGDGHMTPALTDNFLKLRIAADLPTNQMVYAKLCTLAEEGLHAELQSQPLKS
ncbi:MAG: tRNA (N(6)-L-threonylcarbamoyladenosine(37)-C(2))-methylthiotransferase MtaB [Acidobacteriaceae bacterium]